MSLRPIQDVAAELGLGAELLVPFGRQVAKVELAALEQPARGAGRLILVSAMTPDRAGVGKTTISAGLAMGLRALGRRSLVCLREPSLGPVFGRKGGGTGGGQAQVEPADSINLQFTGDIGAVQSANNLLAALVDNALFFRSCDLDPEQVAWRRVLDMNDRSLRQVVIGLGGHAGGMIRETGFDVTAASEVMAVLCLASSRADLEARLGRMVAGWTRDGRPVTAADLDAVAALGVLLKDALLPNLVQTREGGPAFVHGGPFANLAHGCSSLLATRLALRLADDVVTEAGFGFDLGGEKFLHLKCPAGGIWPRCVVLAVSLRALRHQGGLGRKAAARPDADALRRGFANLDHHLDAVRAFGLPAVVAVNVHAGDPASELEALAAHCAQRQVPCAPCEAYARGGDGARELAQAVCEVIDAGPPPSPRALYAPEDSLVDKLRAVARTVYGAADVHLDMAARRELERLEEAGYGGLPVCVAKTPFALSDPAPGVTLGVRELRLQAGAGFLVALTGAIQTMPGLPRRPRLQVRLEDGRVRGLLGGEES